MAGHAQNEIQVAPGDHVQIGFCIYNLNGFIDTETLAWSQPTFAKIDQNMQNFMEYNRDEQLYKMQKARPSRDYKIICDTDRICDVEDSVYDWIRYDP